MSNVIPDFSVIDTVVGVVAGFALNVGLVGLLLKSKVLSFGGAATSTTKCLTPADCPAHMAEYERSLRNKTDIANLDNQFGTFKTKIYEKLDNIETLIAEVRLKIAELHR